MHALLGFPFSFALSDPKTGVGEAAVGVVVDVFKGLRAKDLEPLERRGALIGPELSDFGEAETEFLFNFKERHGSLRPLQSVLRSVKMFGR